jgi:hypothetical protein
VSTDSNKVDPEAAPWVVSVHGSENDEDAYGCGVVIDERRILTCRHVRDKAVRDMSGEIWVAFPFAPGGSADTRLLVKGTVLPVAPDTNKTAKDLAVLHLSEPVPAGVTAAPLRFPTPASLITTRWWALGFPEKDPFGSTASGTVKSWLARGWIQLDADSPTFIEHGFSGGGLWSPDHQAVVAIVSAVANQSGGGRAITLHQAADWFPEEALKSLWAEAPGIPEAVSAEPAERNYALLVWRKAARAQRDLDGRQYGETGGDEDVQLDADRMWWPIARWRLGGLKALIFITDGKVNRIREVYGVDEETTGESSSLALQLSPPLSASEVAESLPALPVHIGDERPAVQGKLREYLVFLYPAVVPTSRAITASSVT